MKTKKEDYEKESHANKEYDLNNKMDELLNWFKKIGAQRENNPINARKITLPIAIISFISGSLLINKEITGNTILSSNHFFNPTSLIGLFLVLFSVILTAYALKHK